MCRRLAQGAEARPGKKCEAAYDYSKERDAAVESSCQRVKRICSRRMHTYTRKTKMQRRHV